MSHHVDPHHHHHGAAGIQIDPSHHDMRSMYAAKMAYDPSKMSYDHSKMSYDQSLACMMAGRSNMLKPTDLVGSHIKPEAASLLHHLPNIASAASYSYHGYDLQHAMTAATSHDM